MADSPSNLPATLVADRALVQAFVDNAKPGELPNAGVVAAQARCQQWLDESRKHAPAQEPPQPQLSAIERFKGFVREDAPKPQPAWNVEQAFADSTPSPRAADKFKRQRLEQWKGKTS
jgi:hypothetical protein